MSGLNPFDALYVSESIRAKHFVKVFSPLLVHETLPLFQPGNVVLKGTQGAGKSMLLTLLMPQARISYAKAGLPFPVANCPRFIGAGINLTMDGATAFGDRQPDGAESPRVWESYFADFVNNSIVLDLLASVAVLAADEHASSSLQIREELFDMFAREYSEADEWRGGANGVTTLIGLRTLLHERIRTYRNFLNYNIDAIPQHLRRTKTTAGEPVAAAVRLLRELEVVPEDLEFFIRVDQYEWLDWIQSGREDGPKFSSVIHRLLSSRDPHVSYRVGTRRHAWPEIPEIQGLDYGLENLRNYRVIDLDHALSRREHSRGLFPAFAEDVFARRLEVAGIELPAARGELLKYAFGTTPDAREEARRYVRPHRRELESPTKLSAMAESLRGTDPLLSQLGRAWVLQKGDAPWSEGEPVPWSPHVRPWWYKERADQALLQLASQRRQRLVFSGNRDVLELSGRNILVFISICQSIWDAWHVAGDAGEVDMTDEFKIHDSNVQAQGIYVASAAWVEKIRSDPSGDARLRFVQNWGNSAHRRLRDDTRMSYPGHTGISLRERDLRAYPSVDRFLREATSFGVLVDSEHTSRNRGEGKRRKWYLASIYAPYFGIPYVHTKEPLYSTPREVRSLMEAAGVRQISGASGALAQEVLF